MHFTITPVALLPALADAVTGIAAANHWPILHNVKLDLSADGLILTATDLETEIITRAEPASTPTAGAITVDAKRLLNICKALPPDTPITAKLDSERLRLTAAGSRYALATLPAADFPAFDRTGTGPAAAIPADLLYSAIATASFAMAVNDVRYYLNGLHLYTEGGNLYVIASDGHRLVKWQAPADDLELPPLILPGKAVNMIARKLKGASLATLAAGSNKIVIAIDGQSVAAKLIEGRFPDWQRVWPRELPTKLRVHRETLIRALQRIALIHTDKYRSCALSVEGAELRLNTEVQGEGEGHETIAIHANQDIAPTGFNAAYLIDALNAATGDEITMGFTEGNTNCLIESEDMPGVGFIVMPMRT